MCADIMSLFDLIFVNAFIRIGVKPKNSIPKMTTVALAFLYLTNHDYFKIGKIIMTVIVSYF